MQTNTKMKLFDTGQSIRVTRKRRVTVLMFSLLCIYSVTLSAKSEVHIENHWHSSFPQLLQVGEGRMTWFGFSIYSASLWTADGRFESLNRSLPLALQITYAKNISQEKLIETTLDQWRQLNISTEGQRHIWATQLSRIWPNVKPGDSIITVLTRRGETQFFDSHKRLGTISDPSFGPALLSIWLHPETTAPELRAKLIGHQGG